MKYLSILGVVALLCLLCGCESRRHHTNHDPSLKIPERDYETLLTSPPVPQKTRKPPQKKPLASLPKSLSKLVSLTSTDQLPVKDALMELAHQTKAGLVIDPSITGTVMLQAHDQRFIDVLKSLCAMTKLRYRVEGTIVYVEPDKPYLKTYNIQFLNLIRDNESKISIATDVFSSMQGIDGKSGQGTSEVDNGSNTLLKGKTKVNFWEELEMNLGVILGDGDEGRSSYSLHKQAGILSLKATSQVHEKMERYLELLADNIAAQVLIEAKIVEVSLSDEYQSGINWHSVKSGFNLNAPLGAVVTPGAFDSTVSPTRDVFSIGAAGRSLTAIASLLSRFGTVRTLSNPRITVLNNQPAVLKVATNQVFFQVDYNRQVGNDNHPETERASSRIQTVPIGLVMLVQPSINRETGKITLNIRPTISRVTSFKEDPAIGILTNNTRTSQIPEIQVREIDSVLHVGTGEVIVMGGLMEERSDNTTSGIPDAKNVPLFGALLKSKTDNRTVTELVILLRVTILESGEDSLSPADERVYTTFAEDPRPVFDK